MSSHSVSSSEDAYQASGASEAVSHAGEAAAPATPPGEDTAGTRQALADDLDNILEALLLASEQPLSLDALQRLLSADGAIDRKRLRAALGRLAGRLEPSSLRLDEVASGWRVSVRDEYAQWVHRLWQEKPPKLSRALLETLAIICYRQPVTRSDIEEVRGVTVSANILRTLTERGWIREAGVREVPGRPALLVTTPQLLDDLGLKSLDDLPSLPEVKDPEQLEAALQALAAKRGIDVGPPPPKQEEIALADEAAASATQAPEAEESERGVGSDSDSAPDSTPDMGPDGQAAPESADDPAAGAGDETLTEAGTEAGTEPGPDAAGDAIDAASRPAGDRPREEPGPAGSR